MPVLTKKVPRKGEACLLEDRICSECGECDRCELNPDKICNNCCECIQGYNSDYAEILIDDILTNTEEVR